MASFEPDRVVWSLLGARRQGSRNVTLRVFGRRADVHGQVEGSGFPALVNIGGCHRQSCRGIVVVGVSVCLFGISVVGASVVGAIVAGSVVRLLA